MDTAHADSQPCHKISRRSFLQTSAGAACCLLGASPALGAVSSRLAGTRRLSFYNVHTGERLHVSYSRHGRYLDGALSEINHLLRDYRTGEVIAIDPNLLDCLYRLSRKSGQGCTFHVISGYRSPATNAMLRKRSRHVARNSYHMYGRAIDIFLPHCRLDKLRRLALNLRAGGVGYYPKSGFVHVDTGPLRHW